MLTVVKLVLTVFFSATLMTAVAQKPKSTDKNVKIQKFTPPKLKTQLGIRFDTAYVFVEEAVQLVKLPLKVTDEKKNVYTISSYRMAYRRRAVTEDEESGKVSPIISNVSDLFRETPLPALWVKIISQQIRAGEEIYFYDIVAKDTQGRLMFAPELRIRVKK